MLDLGFVSAILADHTFEEVISFASEHRFKCVELMCWPKGKAERRYAGVTHIDATHFNEKEGTRTTDYLKEKNVYISALGYYPNLLDPDPVKSSVYINHFKKVIVTAAHLGVGRVNTFAGRDPSKNLQENFNLFKKIWPELVTFAEDHQIKIGIENCPMFFSTDEWPAGRNMAVSPAIWEQMFDIIPSSSFGLNYDPSHLVWQQMDYVQPLYDFKERIFHVHLKDVKVYRQKLNKVGILATPLEYHSPKLPGLGDVNWSSFFTALTDIRYRGPVCIEVEDKAFEGSKEDIREAILISRNFLRQYIQLQDTATQIQLHANGTMAVDKHKGIGS